MVLTSGHCFDYSIRPQENDEYVGIGLKNELYQIFTTESNFRKIKKVHFYTEYKQVNENQIDHDLAIVEIERPFKYNHNIQPACLNLKEKTENNTVKYFVSGFSLGKQILLKTKEIKNQTLSESLRKLENNEEKLLIHEIDMKECRISRTNKQILNLICFNRSIVIGDTGINLAYLFKDKFYITGLVSGLVKRLDEDNKKSETISTISFVSIYPYMNWINQQTNFETCPKVKINHPEFINFITRIGTYFFIISLILLFFLNSMIKDIK